VTASERETSYFEEKCLPLARAFIRSNHINYSPDFPTNSIRHWSVEYSPNGIYSSRIMLGKGELVFMFTGTDQTNRVDVFNDFRTWNDVWMAPQHVEKLRAVAAKPNTLTSTTALSVARALFRYQGHQEKDFHPVIIEQVVWARDVPGKRIVLPLYQVEWIRNDVRLPEDKNRFYPHVRMTVSGSDSNVVAYANLIPLKPIKWR
jgi:hypothetical protein